MTFKDWIISERAVASGQSAGGPEATVSHAARYREMATAMHGGIQGLPGSNINNNMPVRSKISSTDQVKEPPDMEETPEKMFGFKQWLDKKRARESGQKDIHKKRQGSPMRVPRVYT